MTRWRVINDTISVNREQRRSLLDKTVSSRVGHVAAEVPTGTPCEQASLMLRKEDRSCRDFNI